MGKLQECSGKVAVPGYCLDELMTFLTAVRYGVDALRVVPPARNPGSCPPYTRALMRSMRPRAETSSFVY